MQDAQLIRLKYTNKKLVYLLVLFLLVFPKGGFKVASIPITWGYILLGITSFFCLFRKTYVIEHRKIFCLIALLPFQLVSLVTFYVNGVESFGFFFSFILHIFFIPYFFLLILSQYIDYLDKEHFFKIFKNALFFLALYGIVLFFYKLFFHSFIEIPFLTTNFHDFGELDEKNIDRGSVFKLISTYNNGNLYGICMLLFLPLYQWLEKNIGKKFIFILSLLLTFSRTVWIGLLLAQGLYFFFIKKKHRSIFIFSSFFILSLCYALVLFFDLPSDFFFDVDLGGRVHQLSYFQEASFFGKQAFEYIDEIVYLGVLKEFGILGLITFLLAISAPIFIFLFSQSKPTFVEKSILSGLITYLVISFSDGAMLLIPTLGIFWFLVSLLFSKESQA